MQELKIKEGRLVDEREKTYSKEKLEYSPLVHRYLLTSRLSVTASFVNLHLNKRKKGLLLLSERASSQPTKPKKSKKKKKESSGSL
jgi:hypothetical protein